VREGKSSGEWRRRCYLSAGQGDVEEPSGPKVTGAWRRAETTGGCKINLSPLAAAPKTLRISPLAAPKITPRMILRLASESLESARRVEMLGGAADFCSPTKAAVGLPSSELSGRDAQSSSPALAVDGILRSQELGACGGARGPNATAFPIGHIAPGRLICSSVEELSC
jgi:hypothetical protein